MDKKYCIANWKMNMTLSDAILYFNNFKINVLNNEKTMVIFCPPAVSIHGIKEIVCDTSIEIGAQNISFEEEGALTGEISGAMLEDLECRWVLVGHSERRQIFKENNNLVFKKFKLSLSNGLTPILCIGETLEERKSNQTEKVLTDQLHKIISTFHDKEFIVAYEPVWAIGTGISADLSIISSTHDMIKKIISEYNDNIPIIYGGSVDQKNSKEIGSLPNVNGFLVGGASLDPDIFYKIYSNL